jgi:SAM-dependent methyltransferase
VPSHHRSPARLSPAGVRQTIERTLGCTGPATPASANSSIPELALEAKVRQLEKRADRANRQMRKLERTLIKQAPMLPGIAALTGLTRRHAVLDVGCGPGQLTREFVLYLDDGGSYHGLDVREAIIDQLKLAYGDLPNFHFHHADLSNSTYNHEGGADARAYRFPLESDTIDLVVLRSVFTHLVPDEIENYLTEIGRVLRPGGRAYITYFLLSERSLPIVRTLDGEMAHPLFRVDRGDHLLNSDDNPAHAVAVDEALIRGFYDRNGMRVVEPVRYGSWPGQQKSYVQKACRQDVVVAEKQP